MTGALIVPKDNQPVQENTNKVISYESTKEIFLSRKKSFPMEDAIDINNHEIENLPLLILQATKQGIKIMLTIIFLTK